MEQLKRREFIYGAGSAFAITCGAGLSWPACRSATVADPGSPGAAPSPPSGEPPAPAAVSASNDTLDEALDLLKDTGPEYQGRAANHGPMTAEALCVLGRPGSVLDWVRGYKRALRDVPAARSPVSPTAWPEALGAHDRLGDWLVFFEHEMAESPWPAVLDTWVARLAPGLAGAAAHGIIRTGHAARSLSARDTPLRRRELAHGLGYWAASFQPLPSGKGAAPGPSGSGSPSGPQAASPRAGITEALARVETFHPKRPAPRGSIVDGLAALDDWPSFAGVADLVDTSGDVSHFLSDLTEAFAQVYLDNSAHHTITFVHAVTGPSALRLLAPHLSPETTRAALRYAWQAPAGMYAAYGIPARPAPPRDPVLDVSDLIDRAIRTGDEHAIKLTEACLREHTRRPSPVYLAAARDVIERLG